jgi:hypothetical protein
MKTIWCLFSIDNNYNQPTNNLCIWWAEKPSLEILLQYFNVDIKNSEIVVSVVKIWSGQGDRLCNTDYRLNEIEENKPL